MGITRVSGPLYGAKSLLLMAAASSVATGGESEIFEFDVPADEDWYITNVNAYCTACDSSAATCNIKDDGTAIMSAVTFVADDNAAGTITATAGEDEGKAVAGGSALTFLVTAGNTTAVADVHISVHGFIRAGATKKAGSCSVA